MESLMSDVGIPKPRTVDQEWERIKKLRVEIWSLRSNFHEMRTALRAKQQAKSTADDKYFQCVRIRMLGMSSQGLEGRDTQATLVSLFEDHQDCQRIRDEYGSLEDDCNLMEDKLSCLEYELTMLEERFFRQASSQTEVLVSSNEIDLGDDREYHPLVVKFLSKLGDIDILRERIVDIQEEKFVLDYEKITRGRLGLQLCPEDAAWLDTYEDARGALVSEIEEAEKEVESLRQKCLTEGLIDEDGQPKSSGNHEKEPVMEGVDIAEQASEFVKFPLLLPRPQLHSSDPEEGQGSKTERINNWLLQSMRTTSLDIGLLQQSFESVSDDAWQTWSSRVLTLENNYGTRKYISRQKSRLRILRIFVKLLALHFGSTLPLLAQGMPTEPPPLYNSSGQSPFTESLLWNAVIAGGLGTAYMLIAYFDKVFVVMIAVAIGSFFLGMDNSLVSDWQLAIICTFSASLIIADLQKKLSTLPRSGGLIAFGIATLGVLSAGEIAYFFGFEGRYEFEGRFANPWVLGAVAALPTTMLWTVFWTVAFLPTDLARDIENGEYNEPILLATKEVLRDLFLAFIAQIPGLGNFGDRNNARGMARPPMFDVQVPFPPPQPHQIFEERVPHGREE